MRPTGVTGGKLQWDYRFIILILGKEEHRPSTVTTEVLELRAFLSSLRVSGVQLAPQLNSSFGFGVGNEPVLLQDESPQSLCLLNCKEGF